MNYLAHLHLGGQRPGQLLGSLYGDFVKGRLQGQFAPEIEGAIQLHRSIDVFTDRHPLVDVALSRFSLTRRRYAGIVLDVFFDHCLARLGAVCRPAPGVVHLGRLPGAIQRAQLPGGGGPRTWWPMTGWGRIRN
jgi:acyl carrier protein phosphodiesterase